MGYIAPRPNLCYTALGMTKTLCRIVFLATFALAAPFTRIDAAASDPFADTSWQLLESTDEITDETSYYVFTTGSKVGDGLMHYTPDLVIRVKPKGLTPTGGMKYKPEIMIQLGDFDGVDRHGCELTLRYDKRKPLVETWIPSTDRRAMFAPDNMKTLKRLEVSTNLTARFTTTLGHVRTSTFNVTGLTNALEQVKTRYLSQQKK